MNKNELKESMSNSILGFAILFTSLITSYGCSSPNINGYTSDLDTIRQTGTIQELNFEVLLRDANGDPINAATIILSTKQFEENGITNSAGRTSLVGRRSANEPLVFKFSGKGFKATEILSHLPTSFSEGGLVFELVNDRRVRLSHYSIDGLYR